LATAREKLYDEVVALIGSPPGGDAEASIKKIMTRYRVQTKPGVNIGPGETARDALGERLLELWRTLPPDAKAQIGSTIDEFRMQVKQRSSGGAKPKKPPTGPADEAKKPAPRPAPAPPAARPEPTPFLNGDDERPDPLGRRRVIEPVGGGPRRRGKTRGECPKCHSQGVVLARSYAGDEYYSCIYCGWQAYRPADENDPTASLAVRLLGQTVDK
jgi:hypothetical protein